MINSITIKPNTVFPKICILCGGSVGQLTKPKIIKEHVSPWLAIVYPMKSLFRFFLSNTKKEINVSYFMCRQHRTKQTIKNIVVFLFFYAGAMGMAFGQQENNSLLLYAGITVFFIAVVGLVLIKPIRAILNRNGEIQVFGLSKSFIKQYEM